VNNNEFYHLYVTMFGSRLSLLWSSLIVLYRTNDLSQQRSNRFYLRDKNVWNKSARRRDHLRTQKASKLLAAGDPTGELTPLPNCRPSQSHTPLLALRAGAKQLRVPKLLLNRAPQSLATPLFVQ